MFILRDLSEGQKVDLSPIIDKKIEDANPR